MTGRPFAVPLAMPAALSAARLRPWWERVRTPVVPTNPVYSIGIAT